MLFLFEVKHSLEFKHNRAYVVWNLFVKDPNVFIMQLKIHFVTVEY